MICWVVSSVPLYISRKRAVEAVIDDDQAAAAADETLLKKTRGAFLISSAAAEGVTAMDEDNNQASGMEVDVNGCNQAEIDEYLHSRHWRCTDGRPCAVSLRRTFLFRAFRSLVLRSARELLERVLECLDMGCVSWARLRLASASSPVLFKYPLRFEDYFSNRVKHLTFSFPEDATTSTGALFWSAPERFPRPLQFSSIDPSHLQFVMAASILRAETFGISVPDWAKNPEKLAEAVHKSGAKKLPPGFHMNPIQFEKCLIPAIATSMAMATGLVCLELYKELAGGHNPEDYRNTFANLSLFLPRRSNAGTQAGQFGIAGSSRATLLFGSCCNGSRRRA
ncbi:Ubiquitin-activating enzyme e1 C-terminal domain [Musa troglodytarum]|uniref:Ubiquitin-activating enzyme e1 C-terminal domain n=1 Tax=Musa troglodytarum TaxID=320322 RepID=A0A9E7EIT8_9LILI|nr:Ubiquitin-activating enzyme e1 C-terminal domain [Musa troglodytarum]